MSAGKGQAAIMYCASKGNLLLHTPLGSEQQETPWFYLCQSPDLKGCRSPDPSLPLFGEAEEEHELSKMNPRDCGLAEHCA